MVNTLVWFLTESKKTNTCITLVQAGVYEFRKHQRHCFSIECIGRVTGEEDGEDDQLASSHIALFIRHDYWVKGNLTVSGTGFNHW